MKSKQEQLKSGREKLRMATEEYIELVEQLYPIGTVVDVKIGEHIQRRKIVGISKDWERDPGHLAGRNLKTKLVKKFPPTHIVAEVR